MISFQTALILFAIIGWVSAAFACIKLDAVLAGNTTRYHWSYIILAICTLPFMVVYLVTCKHHINNWGQDHYDF